MKTTLRNRQGTAYAEYFLAAAAMAGATMWVWTHVMPSLESDRYRIRNGIMDQLQGPCTLPPAGHSGISC